MLKKVKTSKYEAYIKPTIYPMELEIIYKNDDSKYDKNTIERTIKQINRITNLSINFNNTKIYAE